MPLVGLLLSRHRGKGIGFMFQCVPVDVAEAIRMYEDGMTLMEVGKRLGCSWSTVQRRLVENGIEIRHRGNRGKSVSMQRILELHEQGLSDYEIAGVIGISHQAVNDRLRRHGIHRGRGGNSRKGGIACGRKNQEKAKKRFDSVAHLVELLEYMGREQSRVRCVKCGRKFMWYKDHWKMDVPCPDCRAEIKRSAKEQEQKQKKHERQQQLEAAREWLLSTPRICKHCGMPFYSEYEMAAYCSPQCKRRAKVLRNNNRHQGSGCRSKNPYKRRMRIKVTRLTYDRTVTLDAVYKKFRGRCCDCGCDTVRSKEYRPDRATLDHIVALGNNGTHTWDNVQLLCSDCNSKKRDLGQMRLPMAI